MHESVERLAALRSVLMSLDADVDDDTRIDRIRVLEEIKSAVAAAQAGETARFVESQRAAQRAAGVPAERAERGIAAQVALAKKISPYAGQRFVGWAKIVTSELPETFAALRRGEVSEWRATLLARETIFLSRAHRAQVDRLLASRLGKLADNRLVAEARRVAYQLDPAGFVERQRAAAKDRRVSLRPAPDTMARLTALLPLTQGVAAYAALCRTADSTTAAGDERGRGQIMADTLVERLTGQATAEAVPVEVTLVMSSETLLDGGSEPATIDGEPVPAPTARDLVLTGAAPVWMRRVFTAPATGELVAVESRRRLFTTGQRRFVHLRDQRCRTPYCDAPIRHTDHVIGREQGGPTSIANAQGLCVACNHAKQAPGWRARPWPSGRVTITTPTGHRYRSRPPQLPIDARSSPLERQLADLIRAA